MMQKILCPYYAGPFPAKKLLDEMKGVGYDVLIKGSCYIHQTRNRLVSGTCQKRKQKHPEGVYFWVDADVEGTIEDAQELIDAAYKYKIIGAPYRTQLDNGIDCCGKMAGSGIVEVSRHGFGFMAVHSDVFNKLEYPYFEHPTIFEGDYAEVMGEDLYFIDKARKAGFKTYAHYGIEVKHHIRKGVKMDQKQVQQAPNSLSPIKDQVIKAAMAMNEYYEKVYQEALTIQAENKKLKAEIEELKKSSSEATKE